jgi:hypothetical protein
MVNIFIPVYIVRVGTLHDNGHKDYEGYSRNLCCYYELNDAHEKIDRFRAKHGHPSEWVEVTQDCWYNLHASLWVDIESYVLE